MELRSVTEKPDKQALKVKTSGQEQMGHVNQQNWNKTKSLSKAVSPPAWPAATAALYMLCTGNIVGICALSEPPSLQGVNGARGIKWAAELWMVSIALAAGVAETAISKMPKALTSVP